MIMENRKRQYNLEGGSNILASIFRAQDQSLTDFTAAKRKTQVRQKQIYKKRPKQEQKVQDNGRIRMNMIQQNLALVKEASKRCISKFFPHRPKKDRMLEQKTRQLKVIAYSLIKKGYGFNLFEEYVQQNAQFDMLNREKYKCCTITIIQKCFRRMESFIKSQCSKPIQTMRHEQMRLLVRYLLRFNIYFQKVQAAAIVKFISHVYDLHAVTITQNQTLCLYRASLSILKTILKGGTMKAVEPQLIVIEKQQKQHFWSKKYHQQVIQLYKLNQNYPKIHKCFVTMHPVIQSHFSPQFIQKKLQNVFRETLAKLNRYKMTEVPHLIELNDTKKNFIIKSPTFRKVRLALLDFKQRQKRLSASQVGDLITQINEKFDYCRNNKTKQPPKAQKIKQEPTAFKTIKHLRAEEQQKAKDWSRDVMQYGKIEDFYQTNPFMTLPNNRQKQRQRDIFNLDGQVSQEYSDS